MGRAYSLREKCKKILLMTFEYPVGGTYCGGVGQMVKLSRESFKQLGHQIYVLISAEFQKKHPVKVLMPDNSIKEYSSFYAFKKALPLEKFNFVIQHFVNWVKELEKINKKTKIIYHFHSLLRREEDSGFKTLNKFLVNQERMLEIAHKIICPSRFEYDNFTRYFPEFIQKVILIENEIEVFNRCDKTIDQIRQKLSLKSDDILSIYVGRMEKIKGANILINHLPRLLSKNKNRKIVIVGRVLERHFYRKIRNLIQRYPRQIFYYRYLEKALLFQYYYLSDIFVNPSLSESFSLATHECAYCKTALLINPLPVFDKFKEAAFFLKDLDVEGNSFIESYNKLLSDKNHIKKLAIKSQRVISKELSSNVFMSRLSKALVF